MTPEIAKIFSANRWQLIALARIESEQWISGSFLGGESNQSYEQLPIYIA
jgi:hypothetical protein